MASAFCLLSVQFFPGAVDFGSRDPTRRQANALLAARRRKLITSLCAKGWSQTRQ